MLAGRHRAYTRGLLTHCFISRGRNGPYWEVVEYTITVNSVQGQGGSVMVRYNSSNLYSDS